MDFIERRERIEEELLFLKDEVLIAREKIKEFEMFPNETMSDKIEQERLLFETQEYIAQVNERKNEISRRLYKIKNIHQNNNHLQSHVAAIRDKVESVVQKSRGLLKELNTLKTEKDKEYGTKKNYKGLSAQSVAMNITGRKSPHH